MADNGNETWLLEAGDRVIEKKAEGGHLSLTAAEHLTYCLWVADYGMRNAGDLTTAADLYPAFLSEGFSAAQGLGLTHAATAFSLSPDEFERRYFELFDNIISEARLCWGSTS